MSKKIASLYAEIGADTSKFEAGTKKTKTALDQQAAAFAKFSADASRNAKSYVSYEAQKAKAIAATERAAKKLALEEERAAKAAAKAAEARRKESLVMLPGLERNINSTKEWGNANAGMISVAGAVVGAVVGIGVALDKVSDSTVAYANNVRLVSNISQISAEEASRTIQLLDDYKIGVDDITTASKKMKDNGLVPTIDTIASLAARYQAIKDPAEKLKFAQDNLGKSTKEWLEVLNQSPEALRAQAAGISENLIMTQKQLDASRRLEIAQDQLGDTAIGWGNIMGNVIVPAQSAVVSSMTTWAVALEKVKNEHKPLLQALLEAGREVRNEQEAILGTADAAEDLGDGLENLSEKQETTEETAKRMTAAYSGLLSAMFTIQKQNDSYEKTIENITKKDEDLAAKKNQLTLQMWEEQRAGKLTNEENLKYVQQLDEITKAQAENAKAREDAAVENEKASKQRQYDLVQERLKADGIISSGEYEYLQNLAVQKGLVSRAAADQAIAESQAADQMVASFQQTLPPMERTLGIMQQIAGYNGTVVNFGVNFQTSGMPRGNTFGTNGINYSQSFRPGQSSPMSVPMASRDSGGAGIAGTPYRIGTEEVYVPKTGGEFIPLGGAKGVGNTYNVVINNPKVEKSENSIRSALKKISYLGVAS